MFPTQLGLLIVSMITKLLDSVILSGNGPKITPKQASECASIIMSEFWMLRPEEILYVFKQAITGKYGTGFNRLDSMTICSWLREYYEGERLSHVHQKNKNLKEERENELQSSKEFYARLKAQGEDPNYISPSRQKRISESDEMKKIAYFAMLEQQYLENKKSSPPSESIF